MIDARLKGVISRLNIDAFVETGTDMGATVAEVSQWFAEFDRSFGKIVDYFGYSRALASTKPIRYPKFGTVEDSRSKIWSVDIDRPSYDAAVENFASNRNIVIVNESSEKFLRRMLPSLADRRVFFFLDAHWGKVWPLRDECREIARLDKFVIVIDDCYVPGKSDIAHPRGDFGFDFYQDRVLCWGYIRDCFAGGGVNIFYPNVPSSERRGWCLVARGYTAAELSFLHDELGFSQMAADDPAHTQMLRPILSSYMDTKIMLRMIFPLSWLRRGFALYSRLTSHYVNE